jgi:Fic family protein
VDWQTFEHSPVGTLQTIKGHDAQLRRDYSHFAFVPHDLATHLVLEPLTYKVSGEAERAVGRLDASAQRLPNPKLLVRPSLIREAVSTSALEGTYAPLLEVLEADYLEAGQRRTEVREILNWIEAAQRGLELIAKKPLCVTMFNELQQILVRGTRGDGVDAGRLRTGQVFIGQRHEGIERSRYVPPPAGERLTAGVDAWERWINEDHPYPLVVKLALTHTQFETLHPYHDGNGRLGRLIRVIEVDRG